MQVQEFNWRDFIQSRHGHRKLIVISADHEWSLQKLLELVDSSDNKLCVNHQLEHATNTDDKHFRQYLGREFDLVIYDAHVGFRASSFSAVSGLVNWGGSLILLCPPLSEWPQHHAQVSDTNDLAVGKLRRSSLFLRLFSRTLENDQTVSIITPESHRCGKIPVTNQVKESFALTSEQQQILASLQNHSDQSPCVIRADRGRGKSTILGIFANNLYRQNKRVLVCAPSKRQLNSFYKHSDVAVEFWPIDRLLTEKPHVDQLIIDEAAMFPAALLQRLITDFPSCIMATTVNGYEGSGRGFNVRVKEFLDEHFNSWRLHNMHQPVRWAENCPLEKITHTLLFNNREARKTSLTDGLYLLNDMSNVSYVHLLPMAWQILVDSHYQTTPDDCQRLLDSAENHLWVQISNNEIDGVMWLAEEPAHLVPLAEQIAAGNRRLPGYLLPQLLTFSYADPQWCRHFFMRVVRIATVEKQRRKGTATRLLKKAREFALQRGCELLGTSFGLTTSLAKFWQQNQFVPVHIGRQSDAASGEVSCVYIQPLTQSIDDSILKLRHLFKQAFFYRLPFSSFTTQTVAIIICSLPETPCRTEALELFVKGSRPADTLRYELSQCLLAYAQQFDADTLELLCDFFLLQKPKQDICDTHKLCGYKHLMQKIKQAFAELSLS